MRFVYQAMIACTISMALAEDCDLQSFGDFAIATRASPGDNSIQWAFLGAESWPIEPNELGWLLASDGTHRIFSATKYQNLDKVYLIHPAKKRNLSLKPAQFTIHSYPDGGPFIAHCDKCVTSSPQPNTKAGESCTIEVATEKGVGTGNCTLFAGAPGVVTLAPCTENAHRLLGVDIIKM